MLIKVKKEYVEKMNKVIANMTKKNSLKDTDTLMSRIIWNYFTNNNSERARAKKSIDKYLTNNEIAVSDLLNTTKE